MAEKKRKIPVAKIIKLAVLSLILLLLLAILLYRMPPSYYKPPVAVPDHVLRDWAGQVKINTVQQGDESRFDITCSQNAINGWLRVRYEGVLAKLPAGVREPHVILMPGRIALAVRWSQGWSRTVLSVEATIRREEGGEMSISITSVRAGRLPLPKSLFLDAADKWLSRMLRKGDLNEESRDVLEKVRTAIADRKINLTTAKYRVVIDELEISGERVHIKGRKIRRR